MCHVLIRSDASLSIHHCLGLNEMLLSFLCQEMNIPDITFYVPNILYKCLFFCNLREKNWLDEVSHHQNYHVVEVCPCSDIFHLFISNFMLMFITRIEFS